jgi:hypothetical protein
VREKNEAGLARVARKKIILMEQIRKFPVIAVLLSQVFVLLLLRNFFAATHVSISPWMFVFIQSLLSSLLVRKLFHLPHWLMTIAILMPPLFYVAFHYFSDSTSLYGVAFVFLALTFSHTLKERVPLYLTNTTTTDALNSLIEKNGAKKVMDLGSGLGGVVRSMSKKNVQSFGVESAPALWLTSSLLSLFSRKGKILRQNIWKTNLSDCDLVYAFLSPAIMEELWNKVQKEMRPGSVFISNSFVVPNRGIKATEILTLEDSRKTNLFVYVIR